MIIFIGRTTSGGIAPALRGGASVGLLLLACACGDAAPRREWTPADHGQPAGGDPDRTPQTDSAPAAGSADALARAAAALWNASCAGCHGRDGRGQGEARPPGAQIADFTLPAFHSSRSDDQLATVIRDGRGMMPAFGKQVNDHGISALVAHIRRFGAPPEAEPSDASTPEPRGEPVQAPR